MESELDEHTCDEAKSNVRQTYIDGILKPGQEVFVKTKVTQKLHRRSVDMLVVEEI